MRIYIIVLAIIVLGGCKVKQQEPARIVVRTDTIYQHEKVADSSALILANDSIALLKDSIAKLNSTIKYSDYRNGRIVTKIQYYITITERRPANKTFFFGWVKRAMRMEK
jgi:hypothetical protein